jgi:hypothetical protein
VSLFSGERSGSSRRIKISLALSTNTVPIVWVETTWDDETRRNAVTINPEGAMEFLLYAPGDEWPRARVFAASDYRATSQMCSG